jgi:hypothetical protein
MCCEYFGVFNEAVSVAEVKGLSRGKMQRLYSLQARSSHTNLTTFMKIRLSFMLYLTCYIRFSRTKAAIKEPRFSSVRHFSRLAPPLCELNLILFYVDFY